MLERVLEPEVMDTKEDASAYETIDNTRVNEEFVTSVLALAPRAGTVLDVGTGPGDIAVLLAQRAPTLCVVAIDLGHEMLAIARSAVTRGGVSDRVTVARADAKATGFEPHSFEMVISNSLVHHIPDPTEFFAEMARVATSGAGLFVKDLHRPESESEHRHLVETYTQGETAYQRRLFSDSLRAALTVPEIVQMCARVGLSGVDVRRSSDRHWCLERKAS